MPPPFATKSVRNRAQVVVEAGGRQLKTVPGFEVRLFAKGLEAPRLMRTAPNGDIFVAESNAGRIRVLRPNSDGAGVGQMETFASGLKRPFGISFYPKSGEPEWVYVANTDCVVRFPYRTGDLKARGDAQVIVPKLPSADRGHWTRDIVFSRDGKKMFVSVGSGSNVAQEMAKSRRGAEEMDRGKAAARRGLGSEEERAAVLVFDPDGKNRRIFATGIRNCVGMDIQPATGDLWCSTNERDLFGDNLPPDYITRVKEGGFYGWPWYYIGAHEDPRHKDARPDLKDKVTVPDVLLQSHAASLRWWSMTAPNSRRNTRARFSPPCTARGTGDSRLGYKIVRAEGEGRRADRRI